MNKPIMLSGVALMFLVVGQKYDASNYTNEEIQRIQEIQEKYNAIENEAKSLTYNTYFSELPIVGIDNKYTTGKFTEQTKKLMEDQLNYYRFLADLEPLKVNEKMMPRAQKGAVAQAAVDKQTHDLYSEKKPESMSQEFWEEAITAVRGEDERAYYEGNIGSSHNNNELFKQIPSYLHDFGDINMFVGHRMSLLGIQAKEFSFGYAERPQSLTRGTLGVQGFQPMYKSDINYKEDRIVTWPPKGVAPTDIFSIKGVDEYFRWSLNLYGGKKWMSGNGWMGYVSYGYEVGNDTKVTLINEKTKEKTEFSTMDEKNRLLVDRNADSRLVFQPKIKDYKSGDSYTVKVTGLTFNEKPVDYEYQVKLFDMDEKIEKNIEGIYGTTPWSWDKVTQTLTFGEGSFPEVTWWTGTIYKDIENNVLLEGKKIKNIKFTGEIKLASNSMGLFSSLSELVTLENMSFLNSSNVTNMYSIFSGLTSLEHIDLSSFDTSRVTNMGNMFRWNSNLKQLDLSNFDTPNLEMVHGMFTGCRSLESLDLSSFNTVNVQDMSFMFRDMPSLKYLNVSSFDTSNVTNMSSMFSVMPSLEKLDLSNFDTSKVQTMEAMFCYMNSVKELDLSSFDTSNATNMRFMFTEMKSIEKLDVSSFDTTKVTSMEQMFSNLESLKRLDLSNFDTPKLKNIKKMFDGTKKLEHLDLTNFNTESLASPYADKYTPDSTNNAFFDLENTKIKFGLKANFSKITKYDYSYFDAPYATYYWKVLDKTSWIDRENNKVLKNGKELSSYLDGSKIVTIERMKD